MRKTIVDKQTILFMKYTIITIIIIIIVAVAVTVTVTVIYDVLTCTIWSDSILSFWAWH